MHSAAAATTWLKMIFFSVKHFLSSLIIWKLKRIFVHSSGIGVSFKTLKWIEALLYKKFIISSYASEYWQCDFTLAIANLITKVTIF